MGPHTPGMQLDPLGGGAGGRFMAAVGLGLLKLALGKLFGWSQLLKTQGTSQNPETWVPLTTLPRDHRSPGPPWRRSCLGRDDPRNPESTSRDQAGALHHEGQQQHRRSQRCCQLRAGAGPGLGDLERPLLTPLCTWPTPEGVRSHQHHPSPSGCTPAPGGCSSNPMENQAGGDPQPPLPR